MPSSIQRTFAGGEAGPELHARADLSRYSTWLRTCRNWIVQRFGGVTNRPGTRFVVEVKDSSVAARLLKFHFNDDQTYVIEAGNLYFRFIRNGVQLESGASPYEVVTPYTTADLPDLRFVQSGDIITIVHQGHAPRELRRTDHTTWTLTAIDFVAQVASPTAVTGSGSAGTKSYQYAVTAIGDDDEESVEGTTAAIAAASVSAFNKSTRVMTTAGAHGFTTGQRVKFANLNGLTILNGKICGVEVLTATTFKVISGYGSVGFLGQTYTSGGTATVVGIGVANVLAPSETDPITVSWTASANAARYHVYREYGGVFGYVGSTNTATFVDIGYAPDTLRTPPRSDPIFAADEEYPATVGHFQQRRLFGCSDLNPQTVWGSAIGYPANFTYRQTVRDDDPFDFVVKGQQVNRIEHLLDLGPLVILTSGGEYIAAGDAAGIVTPTSPGIKQQGYNGASGMRPLMVGNTALYIDATGVVVRDLRYDLEADGYAGRDLTVYAPHLFDGYTIADWDYARIPHSVAWAVRDDGTLLGLTYLREHEVYGWHRHDTGDGDTFENVVCVPEGAETAVYVVVKRTIGGATKRYIERFTSRTVTDVAVDAIFVDSSLTYDGRNESAVTLTLTGGTTWDYTETLTLTASAATYTAADGATRTVFPAVESGGACILRVGDDTIRVAITSRLSATVAEVQPIEVVPAAIRGAATTDWDKAVRTVTGIDHLEGRTVSALGDGDATEDLEVDAGAVTIPRASAVIHVGLPIEADLETLDLESINTETLSDKKKRVNSVTLRVKDTRGLEVGESPTGTLRSFRVTQASVAGQPVPLRTGQEEILPQASWNNHGRVFVRQSLPLPATILAITPSGITGG